jgi:hypothetical protein
MKKHIKPEDLPIILNEETIQILVKMCEEFPKKDFNWAKISELLLQRGQLNIVLDIVDKNKATRAKQSEIQLSDEEKFINEQKKQEFLKKLEKDPHLFFGNMSRPPLYEVFP